MWASIWYSEGCLEALNTYDSAFLSFGPIQQTAGKADGKGELVAALNFVKNRREELYRRYFGSVNLDPQQVTRDSLNIERGYFSVGGTVMDTADIGKQGVGPGKTPFKSSRYLRSPLTLNRLTSTGAQDKAFTQKAERKVGRKRIGCFTAHVPHSRRMTGFILVSPQIRRSFKAAVPGAVAHRRTQPSGPAVKLIKLVRYTWLRARPNNSER